MNWITVREFCEQYGISHQCVYKKIKRWGYKLGDHIREEYGKSKLLDEEAVEFFRPKEKNGSDRKNSTDELREALLSCEQMCSENTAEIKALSDEIFEFKKRILRDIQNLRMDMLKTASAGNEQLSFSDNTHGNYAKQSDGKGE